MALTNSQYVPGMMVRGGGQLGDIPTGAPVSMAGGYTPMNTTPVDATSGGNFARGVSTYGLSVAQGLYDAQQMAYRQGQYQYPGFTASQGKAPEQASMYNYQPTAPLQQIQAPNYQMTAGQAPSYQQSQVGVNQGVPNAPTYQYTANQTPGYNAANIGVNPNQMLQGPQYQGLMGQDYDALQQALQQPGQLEAQRAYELGQRQLEAKMGGQGLYGSTMMGTGMTDLNRGYQETLAKNAASAAQQRYGMQAQDLASQNQMAQNVYGTQMGTGAALSGQGVTQAQNQANLGLGVYGQQVSREQAANQQGLVGYGTQMQTGLGLSAQQLQQSEQQAQMGLGVYNANLGQQQNLNQFNLQNVAQQQAQSYDVYKTQAQEVANQQAYAQQQQGYNQSYLDSVRQWQNQAAQEQQQYQLAQNAYRQQLDEQMLNRALSLSGQGAPLSQAGSTYQAQMSQAAAQQAAAQQASNAATTGAYLGAAGTVAGGLLQGNNLSTVGGYLGSAATGIGNWYNSTPANAGINETANPYWA